jgi:RNA polymerase sigma-70 factor, ECF subfamily
MQVTEKLIEGGRMSRTRLVSDTAGKLDDLVSGNLHMFYRRAFKYLGNAPDAEDAVQEGLLSAYKHLKQFRGQAQISTWLTAIVTNAARMQLRRRRSVLSLDQQYGDEGVTLSERLPDPKPGPEEMCFASEARGRLLRVAKQLSPTLRRTFQLRDIDGLTTKETACLLGVPEGTVKAQVVRARSKLARIMQAKPRGDGSVSLVHPPGKRVSAR